MSLCKCEDLPEFSLLASYLMTPKSPFEPALEVCDESSSELARIMPHIASTRDFGSVTKARVRLCKCADSPGL